MIRTRNFFLFILLLAFLVGAILLTMWFSRGTALDSRYADIVFGEGDTASLTAEVASPEDVREGRLAELREKLKRYKDVVMKPREEDLAVTTDTEPDTATSTTNAGTAAVEVCTNYHNAATPTLNGTLTYMESGGQRTFGVAETAPAVSSTTLPTVTVSTVFTLPLRTVPLSSSSCIGTDVVAVTPTGTPIRNTDYASYKGIGEATLIGYTLDGFELYGQSNSLATDKCGGATVSGVYRYYLSSDRATVLNCFAAIPIAL